MTNRWQHIYVVLLRGRSLQSVNVVVGTGNVEPFRRLLNSDRRDGMSARHSLIAILGCCTLCAGCGLSYVQHIVIPFPAEGVNIEWQILSDSIDDGKSMLFLKSKERVRSIKMWPEWGAGQHVNFYSANDRVLIVSGKGGEAIVAVKGLGSTSILSDQKLSDIPEAATKWKFIGSVDWSGAKSNRLKFFSNGDAPECEPLPLAYNSPLKTALHQRNAPPCTI